LKGSKSSSDAKGLELTAGLAMAGAEENEVIPNGSSNPELALKVSLKFKTIFLFFSKIINVFLTQANNTFTIIKEGYNWGHGLSAAFKLGSLEKTVGASLISLWCLLFVKKTTLKDLLPSQVIVRFSTKKPLASFMVPNWFLDHLQPSLV
jgi:hypothetical protein